MARVIGTVGVLVVLLFDTAFTCYVTAFFLRPIRKVIKNCAIEDAERGRKPKRRASKHASIRNDVLERLHKMEQMHLWGSSLAVFSSSVLYLTLVVVLVSPEVVYRDHSSAFLNYVEPLVFIGNLMSILSDLGMILHSYGDAHVEGRPRTGRMLIMRILFFKRRFYILVWKVWRSTKMRVHLSPSKGRQNYAHRNRVYPIIDSQITDSQIEESLGRN